MINMIKWYDKTGELNNFDNLGTVIQETFGPVAHVDATWQAVCSMAKALPAGSGPLSRTTLPTTPPTLRPPWCTWSVMMFGRVIHVDWHLNEWQDPSFTCRTFYCNTLINVIHFTSQSFNAGHRQATERELTRYAVKLHSPGFLWETSRPRAKDK